MIVLGIETSCDDTSVALVRDDGYVLRMISAAQDLAHAPFGGIVPEIAGRQHVLNLMPLISQLLDTSPDLSWAQVDGIAVTNRPGLLGALIVGVVTAKSLALAKNKPLIGINHLEGHILAPFLFDDKFTKRAPSLPYIALAVSGGHTSLYLVEGIGEYSIIGASVDDAAGEAFDKFAKTIGLGFPGGVQVDRQAKLGKIDAYAFPRALLKEDNLQMSFSGLKSSGARLWSELPEDQRPSQIPNLCASFQEAIVDVLLGKAEKAMQMHGLKDLVITGGVSANSRLRARAQEQSVKNSWNLFVPPIIYCTDNAAMIGFAGASRMKLGESAKLGDGLNLSPSPKIFSDDFKTGSMKKGRAARVVI